MADTDQQRQERYRAAHPERKRASSAASYARTRDAIRDRNLRSVGWTLAEYDAAFAAQRGVCAICGEPPGKIRLSADHCHASGQKRELLCVRCNTLIGSARESLEVLRRAAAYLKKHGA